jgi:hypothetical protein
VLSSGVYGHAAQWNSSDVSEENVTSIDTAERYADCPILTLQPWIWGRFVPPNCQLNFSGLHGAIF